MNANLVNTLETRMLTEPPTEEMLADWRAARARMDVLDTARREAHSRTCVVRGHLSQVMNNCFITFRMEHIDINDPENQEWPTL